MFYIFLFLIVVTPAVIAGMLGWPGIWGTGSAFLEFLIPLPLAGGVFHVPGLIVCFFALKILDTDDGKLKALVGYATFIILIGILTLHIDFNRLYSWLTTDYQPSGSPLRFDSNAVYLFTLTDSFWVWVYAILHGQRFNRINFAIVLIVPLIVLFAQVAAHTAAGPTFKTGGSTMGKHRGQVTEYVFTTSDYNEKLLLDWLDSTSFLGKPWTNFNAEHEAIIFTNSMQLIKWGKYDDISQQNVVATVCSYEKNQERTIHPGLYDCFNDKKTVGMQIEQISLDNPTPFDPWVTHWYARTLLCEKFIIPNNRHRNEVTLSRTCISLSRDFDREKKRFLDSYGKDSKEIAFFLNRAKEADLPRDIPPVDMSR